ncbi:MAG: polysaccharide deacetylase family protein [Bdellovibrionales bacterium]|nr:polysaccharide deacetylase family protein [Bdellovibrionales bacterium]
MFSSVVQVTKVCVREVLASRPFRFLRRNSAGEGVILMYHSLCRDSAELPSSPNESYFRPNIALSVTEKRFRAQMRYLQRNFEVVSLPECLERLRSPGRKKRRKQFAAVTFDDGYRDNLEIGSPILHDYGIPFCIFLATGYLDGSWSPWWYDLEGVISSLAEIDIEWKGERLQFSSATVDEKAKAFTVLHDIFRKSNFREHGELLSLLRAGGNLDAIPTVTRRPFLSWEDVRELARSPLVNFGAHTVHHPVLSQETPEIVLQEAEQSRRRIEEELGSRVNLFAYPYGDSQAATLREFALLEQSGLDMSVTTRFGHVHREHASHLYAIPRVAIDYFDTLRSFRWKMLGVDSLIKNRLSHVVID